MIAALDELFPERWPTEEGRLEDPLALSHLTGDDRVLTAAIAGALRNEVELEDGKLPLGVTVLSKRGHPSGGSRACWAYWMRDVDSGLDEPTEVKFADAIREEDPDLLATQQFCKIKVR
ncbi:hypothetical protein [Brachybacterium alimentarium]|uniref:hypothetical protein n=1 Tax=Brachybacterium alimentarium TaxID=47845 RepID=UPI003FD3E289